MKKILKELQEIKNLLQVIVSNQERRAGNNLKEKVQSEKEYFDLLVAEVTKEYRTHAGISPDQISLVAKTENNIPQLWIDLI